MSFSKTVSVFAALASIFAAGATGWKLANSQQEVPLNPLDQKVMELEKKIEEVTDEDLDKALDKIEKFKDQLKKYRTAGLEEKGEYSYENLVFKFLRRSGYIDKLFKFKNSLMDKKLSLENQEIE